MRKTVYRTLVLIICVFLTACSKPASEKLDVNYSQTESDASGMTPEIAGAYLAVVDELSQHLGYDETEASAGECLHSGFVRDWDGDGTPELCLLLRTSPRDSGSWDGTPVYGWYAPTLYLYTFRDGRAVKAGECDLYFATAGREAVIAMLTDDSGVRYVRWDHSIFEQESALGCYELANGEVRRTEAPADAAGASEGAETAQEFLDALGADRARLLLYNNSGETGIEGEANARELREALAAKAS